MLFLEENAIYSLFITLKIRFAYPTYIVGICWNIIHDTFLICVDFTLEGIFKKNTNVTIFITT